MAYHIRALFLKKPLYQKRTSVVREGLASRLNKSVEMGAEFGLYEFGYVFAMKSNIILHDPDQNCAHSTLNL